MNPLVAQVRVLVDIAALIKSSWAMDGSFASGFHLHQGDVPALGDLVMAESEDLGLLLVELSRVLDQDAVAVALPVNGGPVVQLAVGSLAGFGALDLHVGDVLLQGLALEAFVAVVVVELDLGRAHVVLRLFRGLLLLLLLFVFIVLIVMLGVSLSDGLLNRLLRSSLLASSGHRIMNMRLLSILESLI